MTSKKYSISVSEFDDYLKESKVTEEHCFTVVNNKFFCKLCGTDVATGTKASFRKHLPRCDKLLTTRTNNINLRTRLGLDVSLGENVEVLTFAQPTTMYYNDNKKEVVFSNQSPSPLNPSTFFCLISKLIFQSVSFSKDVQLLNSSNEFQPSSQEQQTGPTKYSRVEEKVPFVEVLKKVDSKKVTTKESKQVQVFK